MTITSQQIDQEKADNLSLKKLLKSQYPRNQKFWLLDSLIKQNNFSDFLKAFKCIGDYVDLSSYQYLQNSLMELVSWFIEPCYRHLSPSFLNKRKVKLYNFSVGENAEKEFAQVKVDALNVFGSEENARVYQGFLDKLLVLLGIVAGYLGSRPIVYTKITRILM